MNTYAYDFDSDRSGCNVEIEIWYDKVEGDNYTADYRTHNEPGHLELIHVEVLAIEGYDSEGEIVYRLEGDEIDGDWICDLERHALQWVEDHLGFGSFLVDELWENSR
jgi:hypothetical protein